MAKLLQGGIVLIHGQHDQITATKTDILVENGRIVRIEPNITLPQCCNVLDCTNKIISPGFVDTHHHLWQTMLKGLLGNLSFMPYLAISKCQQHIQTFLEQCPALLDWKKPSKSRES